MKIGGTMVKEREGLNARQANGMGVVLDWGMGNCRFQILNFILRATQGGGVWNNRV